MDKFLSCYRLTEKCYFVAEHESEEKVLEEISAHLEKAHDIKMTDEMREKAKIFIRMAA